MKQYLKILQLSIIVCFGSCQENLSADEILEKSIETHGGKSWEKANFSFVFRDRQYSIDRNPGKYIYTRSFNDSIGYVKDSLVNSTEFSRHVNDSMVELSEEWMGKYSNSVNSVLYFMQLPYILRDPAVRLELVGTAAIGESPYHALRVTFKEESGGEDFEDEYRYWVHSDKYTVDFLAYNYQTEGGGTRFREAINRRKVGDLMIQDYINYAPTEKFPPLDSLPAMWENNQLEEVSRIINTEVRTIEKK